jgi:RecB family exonuclease
MTFDLTKRPYRHSYSSLKMFKQCPARYAYAHIAKLPQQSSGAMDRGTRLHGLCEDYMKAPNSTCPYDIRKIGVKIYQLRQKGAVAEETWLLDARTST